MVSFMDSMSCWMGSLRISARESGAADCLRTGSPACASFRITRRFLQRLGLGRPELEEPGLAAPGFGELRLNDPGLNEPDLDWPDLDEPDFDEPDFDEPGLDEPNLEPALEKPGLKGAERETLGGSLGLGHDGSVRGTTAAFGGVI